MIFLLWDITNSIAKDYSSQWRDITVSWPTWTSNGKYGGAYDFDWVNDYITVINDSTINTPYNQNIV